MNDKPYPCCNAVPVIKDYFSDAPTSSSMSLTWISIECPFCLRQASGVNKERAIQVWNALPHGWMKLTEYEPPKKTALLVSRPYSYPYIAEYIGDDKFISPIMEDLGGTQFEYWMQIPELINEIWRR